MNFRKDELFKLKRNTEAIFGYGKSNRKQIKAGSLVRVHELYKEKQIVEITTTTSPSGWMVFGYEEANIYLAELDNYVGIWNEINT